MVDLTMVVTLDTSPKEQQLEALRLLLEDVPGHLRGDAERLCTGFLANLGDHLVLSHDTPAGTTGKLHFVASFGDGFGELMAAIRALDRNAAQIVNGHGGLHAK